MNSLQQFLKHMDQLEKILAQLGQDTLSQADRFRWVEEAEDIVREARPYALNLDLIQQAHIDSALDEVMEKILELKEKRG
jgi:hypothetical protein